ncbi:MAG: hypothetical protein H7A43_01105 [Verrucomicrobia bacterium]|nr:hypothetical protein [Kiritimatiellia bacterium]MCP5487222.1 hypothetical protein [Verrucomicrobiota bacterium]
MQNEDVKFSEWIQQGFDIYKANLPILILVSLIALVISIASVGILVGPMMAGMIVISLRLFDQVEPRPEVGALFEGFNVFVPSLLYYLAMMVASIVLTIVLNLLPCIGTLLSVFATSALQAITIFALPYIVEKKVDAVTAIKASIEQVKPAFWPMLGFTLVIGILSSLGGLACGIGMVVTMPLYFTSLAAAYRDVHGRPPQAAA